MEILLLIGGLAVLVLAAAMLRAWTLAEQAARRAAEEAEIDLQTTRRIQDATDTPLPPDDARSWLRDFGGPPAGGG